MMRVHRDWILTPERAALHRPTATMVAADLHLGYAAARRRGGEAVPEPRLEEVLRPIRELAQREDARRLVIAGDLFEDGWCAELSRELVNWLAAAKIDLVAVVPGNHDRRRKGGDELPVQPEGVLLGEWRVVHGDGERSPGPVVYGHFHPCLNWRGVVAPCFLFEKESLMLPAFSRDARGVNVLGRVEWRRLYCGVIVGQDVLELGEVAQIERAACGFAIDREAASG